MLGFQELLKVLDIYGGTGSMSRDDSFTKNFGRDASWEVRAHFNSARRKFGEDHAVRSTRSALFDASFGRGDLAGRTGNPFKDDPFFNPWAPGGKFNGRR
jgi:hypothetical protein